MHDVLNKIIESKHSEIKGKKEDLQKILNGHAVVAPLFKLRTALKQKEMAIIAEVKRKSPSSGTIADLMNPVEQVKLYNKGGAAVISVLTDYVYFGGTMDDLRSIAHSSRTPVLMKDFIVDPIQIVEGLVAGASAVLLIVSVLGRKTKEMLLEVHRYGMEAIVEVHDREELSIALDAGAQIIGVNSRNLNTFQVNLHCAESLAGMFPPHVIKVAESGISTVKDVEKMRDCGYDAILVGEALMRSADPSALIQSFRIPLK